MCSRACHLCIIVVECLCVVDLFTVFIPKYFSSVCVNQKTKNVRIHSGDDVLYRDLISQQQQ